MLRNAARSSCVQELLGRWLWPAYFVNQPWSEGKLPQQEASCVLQDFQPISCERTQCSPIDCTNRPGQAKTKEDLGRLALLLSEANGHHMPNGGIGSGILQPMEVCAK